MVRRLWRPRPSSRLTPHFTWREFGMRDGTLPPAALWLPIQDLCLLYLEPIRRAYGPVTIHSGFRSVGYNAAIGGAPASRHVPQNEPATAAADFTATTGTPREWYAALDRLGAGGLGRYPTHVHVDTRRRLARW